MKVRRNKPSDHHVSSQSRKPNRTHSSRSASMKPWHIHIGMLWIQIWYRYGMDMDLVWEWIWIRTWIWIWLWMWYRYRYGMDVLIDRMQAHSVYAWERRHWLAFHSCCRLARLYCRTALCEPVDSITHRAKEPCQRKPRQIVCSWLMGFAHAKSPCSLNVPFSISRAC